MITANRTSATRIDGGKLPVDGARFKPDLDVPMNVQAGAGDKPLMVDCIPVTTYVQRRSKSMRSLTKYAPILAIFCTVTALAAPDPTGSTPPAPASTLRDAAVMSAGDMNVKSAAIQAQLEEDSQHVLHLKEVAKKQKDVIKLNCVNDRIVEIKAQRNIADDTNNQLQAALSKNSDSRQQLFDQLQATSGIASSASASRRTAASATRSCSSRNREWKLPTPSFPTIQRLESALRSRSKLPDTRRRSIEIDGFGADLARHIASPHFVRGADRDCVTVRISLVCGG